MTEHRQPPLIPRSMDELCPEPKPRTATERNTHGCCDGLGQVHHGEGALSYVTLCRDRTCRLRRDAEFMGVSREDVERYRELFGDADTERSADAA